MSPLEQILGMYARQMPEENFWADVLTFLEVGVVVSTPAHFLMARPVERAAPRPWEHRALYDNPDTWLIWAAAGPTGESVKTFSLQCMPYPLRYVAWARRDGPLKFHTLKSNERPIRS